jgi:hypothetical protein
MPTFVLPKGKRERALKLAAQALGSLDEKVAWQVVIEPVTSERSLAQNSYLWACPIKMISEASGYEPEEVHEYLCGLRWGWKDKKVPKTPRNPEGLESVPIRTTTRNAEGKRSVLTPNEFSEYVAFIQRFAAQKLSIVIPDPDPFHLEHRGEENGAGS